MQDDFYGIKELYDVNIRLNNPVKIGDREYQINESILNFKTAEIAQIQQKTREYQSVGGRHNQLLLDWQIDKSANFAITNGVLSQTSWAVLSNSKLKNLERKSVPFQEELHTIEDNDYCYVELKYCPNTANIQYGVQGNPNMEPMPMGRREELPLKPVPPTKIRWIYCYNAETGLPILDYQIYGNKLFFNKSYRKVSVDYTFTYEDKVKVIEVGDRLINGFLRLDGKMSVKDEKSGEVTTAILEMPKIKLSSNLAMKLGKSYDYSTVSDFYFVGHPEVDNKMDTTFKITFLDKELTGEYI